MRGAGGTDGGVGRFFIGLTMMVVGGYLFLSAIQVTNTFTFGGVLYRVGMFKMTGGLVLVPFIFGIGIIFYNSRNILGWVLTIASIAMLGFGIISNIHLRLQTMTAYELLVILVLLVGGIGLFLSSLRNMDQSG